MTNLWTTTKFHFHKFFKTPSLTLAARTKEYVCVKEFVSCMVTDRTDSKCLKKGSHSRTTETASPHEHLIAGRVLALSTEFFLEMVVCNGSTAFFCGKPQRKKNRLPGFLERPTKVEKIEKSLSA